MSLMCYPSYQHLFWTDHTSTHTFNTVYTFYKYCRTHLAKFDLFCFKDADVRTQLADGWSLRTDKWTGNATTFKTCSKNSQNISKHIQRFSSTEVSWFSFHFKIQACHIWVHCRSLIGKVGQFVTTVRCTEATEATANAKIGNFPGPAVPGGSGAHTTGEPAACATVQNERVQTPDHCDDLESFPKIREKMCFIVFMSHILCWYNILCFLWKTCYIYNIYTYNIRIFIFIFYNMIYIYIYIFVFTYIQRSLPAESLLNPSNPGKAIHMGSLDAFRTSQGDLHQDDHVEPDSCLMLPLPVIWELRNLKIIITSRYFCAISRGQKW